MLHYTIAKRCYDEICSSALSSLRRDLFKKAIEYAYIRAQYQLMGSEEKREIDQHRTIVHNALIDACNILSRNMAKNGEDNSWRALLGEDRKLVGDYFVLLGDRSALSS